MCHTCAIHVPYLCHTCAKHGTRLGGEEKWLLAGACALQALERAEDLHMHIQTQRTPMATGRIIEHLRVRSQFEVKVKCTDVALAVEGGLCLAG